jgi:two-component system, NtrC family, nitrogen regulation sensor histidine kinase GlnL
MAEPKNFYQNFFASLVDGILVISADLKVTKVNQAAEEIFQRSQSSFEGESLSKLFPDQPNLIDKAHQSIAAGISYHHVEGIGYNKSTNGRFPVNLTFSPLMKDDHKDTAGVILIQDNSLLKELQEFSQQTENLSTLSTLTTGMAHEIRNPLSGIRGAAQLLLKELKNNDHREYMEIVIEEVDRINRLVKKMMNLTRPIVNNFKPINIHQVLEEILTLEKETLNKKEGTFVQTYDPSIPTIKANKDELKQVFLNLVKNAVEASPKGGRVQISTQYNNNYTFREKQKALSKHNIVIKITDYGLGMDNATMKKLFTPFFTTKKRGVGLGMAVSLKIVKNHNGTIKVTSEKGIGTVIQVFLPVHK